MEKMQDKHTDFDLSVRSLLEGTEVKPSRGVWDAVSARLDEIGAVSVPAGRKQSQWMGWAGAGLSLAAAAAAAFLIIRPASEIQIEESPVAAPMVAQMLESTPEEPVATLEEAAPAPEAKAAKAVSAAPVAEELAAEESPVTVSEEQPEAPSTKVSENTVSGNAKPERKAQPESEVAESFDWGEEEETATMRRNSFYAKGALAGNSSDLAFNNRPSRMSPSSGVTTGITELSESTYGVPFTLGIGVRAYVLPRLSIGTGVDYSLLTRTFSGKYTKASDAGTVEFEETGSVYHSMQYIGVPLDIYYDIINSKKIDFYVYGGGEAEFCAANNYKLYSNPDINYSYPVRKLQFSAGLGLGVEFTLTDFLGLYLAPEVKYYFNNDQPKNVRTDKPLMVNFNAGLRFRL